VSPAASYLRRPVLKKIFRIAKNRYPVCARKKKIIKPVLFSKI